MSGLMWVKLWRDLRAGWSRFALMVAAITVSLVVFGGVLFAWSAVGRETRGAYMGTEPASATIILQEGIAVDEMAEVVAEVRTRRRVVGASGRTQFNTEVEVNGKPREISLQVFVAAPDDPLNMARFYVENGAWPAGPGEVFLGVDSLGLLEAEIGDTVTISTRTGRSVDLRLADTVYDPSLSPSPQEQTARGYLSTAALASGDDVLDQLKVQVSEPGEMVPTRDRDAIVETAGEIGEWLRTEKGLPVAEIQVPDPYTHPHQFQADSLLLSLLGGGAAALILSVILVANMLNTLFTQQTPQIGIIKAIGARTGRISRFYLTMTLLVAAAATLLAFGPAILIGRAGLQQFLGFLGIQPISVAPPAWAYLIVVLVGLCLLPVMALIPVSKASRTTVREAIDYHGMGAEPNTSTGVLGWITRIRSLDRRLLLALRNTFRRPARFWLSVGLLGSGGVVFVAGMSLGSSVAALGDEQRAQRSWDVEVQLATLAPAREVRAIAQQTPGVVEVEGWAGMPVGVAGPGEIPLTRTYPDQGHGRISLVALPGDSQAFPSPQLLEGRWLEPGETGAVVINQITRNNTLPDIVPGDTVQLLTGGQPTTWTVAGIIQERAAHSAIYTTIEGFAEATTGVPMVNQLRVSTEDHDETSRESVAVSLEETLTDRGVTVESSVSVSRGEAVTEGHLGPIIAIILTIAIAMGVVGGIGLASTMTANVLDRIREFGVMHAVGAQPKTVRLIVVTEGIILALTSVLMAMVPALVLTWILGAGLGNLFIEAALPFRISPLAIVTWLVLITFGAALATDAAANRASRLTVRDALSHL